MSWLAQWAKKKNRCIGAVLLVIFALGFGGFYFHPHIAVAEDATTAPAATAAAPAPSASASAAATAPKDHVGLNIIETIAFWIADIFMYLASGIGSLIALVIDIIVAILAYNNFSTSPIVAAGWAIVRDSVNMFYVILLIAIAFGTIIGYHKFQWQQQIPRLLKWAVIINFSRTLCGLAIDASQVLTLTFANALKDIAGGNFVTFLGLTSIMSFSQNTGFIGAGGAAVDKGIPVAASDYLIGGVMAFVMMLIVLSVLIALVVILAFRIVMLWILVTISPLTWFVGSAKGIIESNAYSQWWDSFKCFLVIGPVLTFFLWLALAVAGAGNIAAMEGFTSAEVNTGLLNQIFDMPRLMSFILGLSLIFAGFDTANTFCQSVAGGSVVSKALGKARGFSKGAALAPLNFGISTAKGIGSRIPLVGERGIGLTRNKAGSALTRGLQTLTRQVPGVLGGAALTRKIGKAAEHFEEKEKNVHKEDAERMDKMSKAFVTDKQKMAFMEQAAGHSKGGKKSGRFEGNKQAILGNLKKAIDEKDYRKKLEEAGVNVGDLLQAYDKDIENTYGHADPKFKEKYKDFKKERADYFAKTGTDAAGKRTYDFSDTLKNVDDLKKLDFKSIDPGEMKKRDGESDNAFEARRAEASNRARQLQDHIKKMGPTGEVDKDGNSITAYEMGRQGKLGNAAKIAMDRLVPPPAEMVAAGLVSQDGTFTDKRAEQDFTEKLRQKPEEITAVASVLGAAGGNNDANRALTEEMKLSDLQRLVASYKTSASDPGKQRKLLGAIATLQPMITRAANDQNLSENKQKEYRKMETYLNNQRSVLNARPPQATAEQLRTAVDILPDLRNAHNAARVAYDDAGLAYKQNRNDAAAARTLEAAREEYKRVNTQYQEASRLAAERGQLERDAQTLTAEIASMYQPAVDRAQKDLNDTSAAVGTSKSPAGRARMAGVEANLRAEQQALEVAKRRLEEINNRLV